MQLLIFSTVTVVGACEDVCLLVGTRARLASFLNIYLFNLVYIIFQVPQSYFVRITVETSVLPTSEGERVSGKKGRSAVSSRSPAAMTLTRTSASAELMAPDKCVMGSYQGQRFTAAAPHDRARMCLTACRTILHGQPDLLPPHARCAGFYLVVNCCRLRKSLLK